MTPPTLTEDLPAAAVHTVSATRPRLAFLGTGWIGRDRLAAIAASDVAELVAVCDDSREAAEQAQVLTMDASIADSFEALLDLQPDGIVIATPSALHASQCIRALERGIAVFCQKPLARTEGEMSAVIATARQYDLLLGVDLSYRETQGMRAIRDLVQRGELGRVFAIDLTFHNAYGPDKSWFRDPMLSGGGCLIDLGTHLVDLALWTLDFPVVHQVTSALFSDGRPNTTLDRVEDAAFVTCTVGDGIVVRIACSWNLHAGRDAVISANVIGSDGAACMENVHGSFTDFRTTRQRGTHSEPLVHGPEAWGGRAAVAWARQLAAGAKFNPEVLHLTETARVLDRAYGRS